MAGRQSPSHVWEYPFTLVSEEPANKGYSFLQCDGEAISLPNLQGIVVLNITSYARGTNFGEAAQANPQWVWNREWEGENLDSSKVYQKESWTDWSVGEKEAGWGPLLAAVWWVF